MAANNITVKGKCTNEDSETNAVLICLPQGKWAKKEGVTVDGCKCKKSLFEKNEKCVKEGKTCTTIVIRILLRNQMPCLQ